MQIFGPSQVHGPQPIKSPHLQHPAPPAPPKTTQADGDQLDISEIARLTSTVNDLPEIRAGRVEEIRTAIENGTYETEERLSGALDRLLDEIG